MQLNPIAQELNAVIKAGNPHIMEMLSKLGRRLFFPKGILSQTAEARQKAYDKFNATIGIATENFRTMCLPSVKSFISGLRPSEALTYAPSYGIPALRNEWKASMIEKNPSLKGKTFSLPIVTTGITHGISVFSDMFLDSGDVVIVPDKYWGNYNLIMAIKKEVLISPHTTFTNTNEFNTAAFEAKVRQEANNHHKVVIILNYPNNPTGYTITESEAKRTVEILTSVAESGTNVIAVFDDSYFGLRYDESAMKESLFARVCNAHPRILAVKLDGATKELFVWGLRVGFITYGTVVNGDPLSFYEAMEKKTAGNIRGTVSNASHIGQSVVLKTLKSPTLAQEREEKYQILKKRALRVKEILKNPRYNDAWDVYPFNSGYFMCLKLKTVNAETLRLHLLDKYKVGLISINDTDLRVAFSSVDEENLQELFDFIYKGVKDLEGKLKESYGG